MNDYSKGTLEKHRADPSRQTTVQRLASFFHRNGYVRRQNPKRVKKDGWGRYKKGDEVRLVAETGQELTLIRNLLEKAGFKPGSPFEKGRQYRQPIYGRKAVARFLELVDAD
jgi:hypothetical protein